MAGQNDQELTRLSAKAQEAMGFTPGTKFYSPFPFAGVNVSASPIAIDDKEFQYAENWFRVGDGYLRTSWDVGPALYTTATNTILSFFWFNIGITTYAAVFFTDGTAIQVNELTGATTVISATVGTFYTTGSAFPACCQSGSQYLLIANNITANSYWIWDGAILYGAGSIGPQVTILDGGSGYTSAPTVTPFGGSGSGIVAVPTISEGAVVALNITNPGTGYLPGDVVQFAFSGGGSDTSAILQAVLSSGAVGSIELLNGGSGFTNGTFALSFTGGGGTGATGTYTVTGNIVTGIALTAGGTGYTSTPTIGFPGAGGTGASAIAILTSSTVASVTVVNGGTGFVSTPTLTFVGGNGTGATATAVLSGGAIASVAVTNGGANYTSAPTVEVQAAVNLAAYATATMMPFGISGSSMETFDSRVWLPHPNQVGPQQNGGTFLVSAPESLGDFATSDGGDIFTSNDRFLKAQYINIRQSNGYLYPLGDSSVSVISNVNTSGSPSETTFNYQNVDPQVGASWRDSCQDFSTTILFANQLGVFGVYGGRALKVSKNLDDLFLNAIFPPMSGALIPSSAVASVFNTKWYFLLLTITDVATGLPRNVMVSWNEKEWFVQSQSVALTYIGTQEISSNITAWGTDGKSLYPLFNQPSTKISKTITTKLYGGTTDFIIKDLLGFYMQAQDKSVGLSGVNFSASFSTAGFAIQPSNEDLVTIPSTTVAPLFVAPSFPAKPPYWPVFGTGCGGVPFINVSATLTTKSPDVALANVILSYVDKTAYQ